ncbi:hypothetical protein EDD11_003975 [Mortierella claussenii]|nr:hypothetical protein EDD11_003975 [Mortierella claussenii]
MAPPHSVAAAAAAPTAVTGALKHRHISIQKTATDHAHIHADTDSDLDTLVSPDLFGKASQKGLMKKHSKHPIPRLTAHLSHHHPHLSAWIVYLGFLFSLVVLAFNMHYTLPAPVSSEQGTVTTVATDPATGITHSRVEYRFSEENVRRTVRYLSEDIGYRIVGTEQDQETQAYLIKELQSLKAQAQRESARLQTMQSVEDSLVLPEFDMWIQVADGSHQFDFMSKVVMKMYTNMTNIVVRLSCGQECDRNAILLNAHYDTTLGSPGAVDDALPVGVMLEIIRIVSKRPALRKNSLIFLFNGGEESLQDASHSFITSHELRSTVRAVINLEGCGTSGPEILFQANSRPMIEAYRKVPYPHGTVMGNDLFSTGIVLSDTDFRQFVEYGNLTGLDMAVYKNSYLYHTHLDLDAFMEQGLPQHLGENTLALATYLADEVDLQGEGGMMQQTKEVVYFDIFGQFFVSYSMETAIRSHVVVALLTVMSLVMGASRPTVRSLASVVISFLAALLTPLPLAVLIQAVGKSMIWFSHEWLPIAIFGPISAAGMLSVQWMLHDKKATRSVNELNTLSSIQMVYTAAMGVATAFKIASSYFLAMYSLVTTLALFFNHVVISKQKTVGVDHATYLVASVIQTVYSSYLAFSLFDLIVPLTGRIGVDAPVDFIVAILSGFAVFSFSPPVLAFSHRFGRKSLKRIITGLIGLQVVIFLLSSALMAPYDTLHPKRVFVQHLRNMSSGESLLYVAHADAGPFHDSYIPQLESLYETDAVFKSGNSHPGDWNSIYPFNQFLDSYVFDTTSYIRQHTSNATLAASKAPLTELIHRPPQLYAENISFDPEAGIRKLTLLCTHPNYIWTVTSFDAEVVSWSMKLDVPSKERFHYVVRHAGGYLTDGWKLDLAYRANNEDDKLRIELTAMETEGFGRDQERELKGSGEIGVMRKLVQSKPEHIALTYFSAVVSNFDL